MKKIVIVLILLFISKTSLSQDVRINAGNGKFIIDNSLKLIVCNKKITSFNNLTGVNSLSIDLDGSVYEFSNIPNELEYGEQYTVSLSSENYKLYFSNLPLININTSNTIVDEPKVLASLILTDTTDVEAITSYCGIELRGGYTLRYPKKSYGIELWEDETGDNGNKISLLNMRDDDDWLLLAMYNEPLRIRNVIGHKLWREIHTPYYIGDEEDAMSGIRIKYVELAVNNEYMGVYLLGERVDRKQLKLKKYKSLIRGELYQINYGNATIFSDASPVNNNQQTWGGFEMKYPKEDEITDWGNLYNFVSFVINSTDNDFERDVEAKFVLENAIDYFIFINLLNAGDNINGRNMYIAKYKEDEPYFYVPWDFDNILGVGKARTYNDILVNRFYTRLLDINNGLFRASLIIDLRGVLFRNLVRCYSLVRSGF